jgi:hypothetical protein
MEIVKILKVYIKHFLWKFKVSGCGQLKKWLFKFEMSVDSYPFSKSSCQFFSYYYSLVKQLNIMLLKAVPKNQSVTCSKKLTKTFKFKFWHLIFPIDRTQQSIFKNKRNIYAEECVVYSFPSPSQLAFNIFSFYWRYQSIRVYASIDFSLLPYALPKSSTLSKSGEAAAAA